jgi:L-rhamnose mutarotase
MRKQFLGRLSVLAIPLGIGMAVGYWWNETAGGRLSAAPAAERAPTGKPVADQRAAGAEAAKPQRFGSVIGLRPEKAEEYLRLHANTWPEVLATIRECNIRNYSIYLGKLDDGKLYLFSYFEYAGRDFQADMKKMAADPNTQRWWKLTDPCQVPQKDRKPDEHWMTMREVFHTE